MTYPLPGANWTYLHSFFVLKPSGDQNGIADTANFQAAVTALGSSGGQVLADYGTYYFGSTVTATTPVVFSFAPGSRINFLGTGDCFRLYSSNLIPPVGGMGIIGNPVIDGSSAGAGSAGVHAGDWTYLEFDATVQNFNGGGSIGWHFDNTVSYTERLRGSIQSLGNTSSVVFDVSGASTSTNSFARPDLDIWINANPNQDGVVCQNGAQPYHGRIAIRGNFQNYTSAQSTCVLRIAGQVPAGHPGAALYSRILGCQLDVQVETTSTGGANPPRTIILGTVGSNAIRSCYGALSFAYGGTGFLGASFQANAAGRSFEFTGPIEGDSNLNAAAGAGSSPPGPAQIQYSGIVYPTGFISSGGSVYTLSGDMFAVTLSSNMTVNLAAETGNTVPAPGRKVIFITQAAAGGPFTVTWPKPGSPTTGAPAVYWPGGTTPTMTATAGAIDKYVLETVDGIHWYGTASQALS